MEVTLKGQTLHLKGSQLKVGDTAPDCKLVGNDLKTVQLSSFKGKHALILAVPSLDTPVCSTETRRFNKEMEKFKDVLNVVCISMDLPFAQSRWCGAEGVKNVTTLSDYKDREFGNKYGLLIEELGLLARTVIVLDPNMKITNYQLVKEVSQEPNYTKVLEAVQQFLSKSSK